MANCVYDNPATMCHEEWEDGILLVRIHSVNFRDPDWAISPWYPWPWEPNKLRGDASAVEEVEGERDEAMARRERLEALLPSDRCCSRCQGRDIPKP